MEPDVYFESLRTSTPMFGSSVMKRFLESVILLYLHYERIGLKRFQYQFSRGARAVMDAGHMNIGKMNSSDYVMGASGTMSATVLENAEKRIDICGSVERAFFRILVIF